MREIAGKDLLKEHFPKVDLWKGLALEGLANRDSLPYAEKYGLGPVDGLRDLYRGTLRSVAGDDVVSNAELRYQGFSKLLDAFRALGLINTAPMTCAPESWQDLLPKCIETLSGEQVGSKDIASFLKASGIGSEVIEESRDALQW